MKKRLAIWLGVALVSLLALMPVPTAAGRLFPGTAFSLSPDYSGAIWAQWAITFWHWPVHYEFSPDFYGAEYALWEIPCWNDPYHYLFDDRCVWDEYASFRWRDPARVQPRPSPEGVHKDLASPGPGALKAREARGLCGPPAHSSYSADGGGANYFSPAYSSGQSLSVLPSPSGGSSKRK